MEGVGVRREETLVVPHCERTDHGNEAAGEAKCISTRSHPGVELGLRRCRVPRESFRREAIGEVVPCLPLPLEHGCGSSRVPTQCLALRTALRPRGLRPVRPPPHV